MNGHTDALIPEAVMHASPFAVISLSPTGIVTSLNAAAEGLIGYTCEEVISSSISQFLELASGTPVEHCLKDVRDSMEHRSLLCTTIRRDGLKLRVPLTITGLYLQNELVGFCLFTGETTSKLLTGKSDVTSAQLKALLASIEDAVFEVDEHGRFLNPWVKSENQLFPPHERIHGRTFSEILGEEIAQPFEDALKNLFATGERFDWEYPFIDGAEQKWFCAKVSVINHEGRPTKRASVCIQDITERKRMELSLRESEEKFRLLAEHIPSVVYLMRNDDTNSIVYVNPEITNLCGYGIDHFLSKQIHISEIIHEDDRSNVLELRAKSMKNGTPFHHEYRVRHRDGSLRWVSETGTAVFSEDRITFFEGCLTDITDRKYAEEQLRAMAEENVRIFNNVLGLGAICTYDGRFRKVNPAWEKTLGWKFHELIDRHVTDFIHPDDRARMEDIRIAITEGMTTSTFENRFRCRDGSFRWLLWSSSADAGRRIIYASAIDITSRKKSEEELLMSKRNLEVAAYELEEQNRQLDEFAHIISHNLRSPVNNIKALLSFINEGSSMSEYQLIFEKIKNVASNISETMNELLETIRIKKNVEIERVELRFKDILDKVIQSLEGDLIESGATVTYNFNNAPIIYYSKAYLESILQNLLSNAIKYRSNERIPEIFVSTEIVPTGIELRVKDNGLGIDLHKFGNKLFGLHKTFHENKEARGVGLFLTKTQIETLGGSITAESEVNKGTTFIIKF